MLIIPEIETVVILVPRTGSGSLHKAILAKYPKATMPYRHMEADGVPLGYDRWRRVGVIRHPVDRLWSIYKFCKTFGGTPSYNEEHAARIRASVGCTFSDWIVNNDVVFATQFHLGNSIARSPHFTTLHGLPENKKSQEVYLRPDLGTEVRHFYEKHALAESLGVVLGHRNKTEDEPMPVLDMEAADHINKVFAWDLAQNCLTDHSPLE